jgi:hypothetical protein
MLMVSIFQLKDTNLTLEIPVYPNWTRPYFKKKQNKNKSTMDIGSVRPWV